MLSSSIFVYHFKTIPFFMLLPSYRYGLTCYFRIVYRFWLDIWSLFVFLALHNAICDQSFSLWLESDKTISTHGTCTTNIQTSSIQKFWLHVYVLTKYRITLRLGFLVFTNLIMQNISHLTFIHTVIILSSELCYK